MRTTKSCVRVLRRELRRGATAKSKRAMELRHTKDWEILNDKLICVTKREAARTILLFHTISARPSKQPRMVGSTLGVYSFGLIFVSARTNKRHHHQRRKE